MRESQLDIVRGVTKERLTTMPVPSVGEGGEQRRTMRGGEGRYRQLFESLPVGLYRSTSEGCFLDVNDTLVRVLGYASQAELLAVDTRELYLSHQDRARWVARLREVGEIHDFETCLRRCDGETIWVRESTRACHDESGVVYYEGAIEDITQRRQAEEALRQSELRYSNLFQQSNDAIIIHDGEGWIVDVNRRAEALIGHDREDFLRLKLQDLLYPGWQVEAGGLEAWKEKRSFNAELHRNGGEVFPAEVSTSRFEVDGKELVQCCIRDTSERSSLEAKLRQAQKMEAVGRLAGGVAHDFNNLLSVIAMYSDLLLSRLEEKDPLYRGIEQIKKAGQRAAALTHQLLAFSRRQVLRPQVLDLNALVADLGTMLARIIRENIELSTNLSTSLWPVKADPSQLEQVIMNLVVNARDAMLKGGKMVVETSNCEVDHMMVSKHPFMRRGQYVRLMVCDTGAGMDPITLSRIFEPFFTTKQRGKGTGLGLSTAYGIVKQSGGYVLADSEVGKGSVFTVFLPRAREVVQSKTLRRREEDSIFGSETVLVVEDDTAVRSLVAEVLTDCGYTLLEAANGREALDVVKSHEGTIDLLLTDVVMPGMSGRELSELVHSGSKEIKVLYMSGYSDESGVQQGVLATGAPFLEKPLSAEALARKIREVLTSDVHR